MYYILKGNISHFIMEILPIESVLYRLFHNVCIGEYVQHDHITDYGPRIKTVLKSKLI